MTETESVKTGYSKVEVSIGVRNDMGSAAPTTPAQEQAAEKRGRGDSGGAQGGFSAAQIKGTPESKPKAKQGSSTPVMNWPAAVEQCGGDEAFVRELVIDMFNESGDHLKELVAAVPVRDTQTVQGVSHSMKGAAANLMCLRLKQAATDLEKLALSAATGKVTAEEAGPEMDALFRAVEQEMAALEAFLQEKGLI
ncbi:unnamed protein product [Phaeothamnion confervicola]